MEEFKEFLIQRSTDFHVSLYHKGKYRNDEQGAYERMRDTIRYEELKEVIRNHPELDTSEIGKEVAHRVRRRVIHDLRH